MKKLLMLLLAFPTIAFATEYKTLAVSVRYLDANSTSVAGLIGSTNTVSKFWNDNSGGKILFPTTVHPVVLTIPKTKPLPGTTCNYSFMQDSYNAIVAAGIDLTQYKRAIVVVPMNTNCPYKGFQSYLTGGIPASFTSSTNSQYIAHELGHTLGLGHANNLTCKSLTTGLYEPMNLTKCYTPSEYGADYDIMAKRLLPSNPPHRAKLGIAQPVIHPIGKGEATYQIPVMAADVTAPNSVKIELANGRALWVEYRQPIGADVAFPLSKATGAQVWATGIWGSGNAWCGDYAPCRVDMDTATSSEAMPVGATYTNAAVGVTISVIDKTPEYLTVTVKN